MELIRGKTFIKSYAQHPPEKVTTVVYKGKKIVEFGKNFNDCDIRGKTFIKSYTQNPPEKVPTFVYKEKKNVEPEKNLSECDSKKNAVQTQRMSNGICPKEAENVRCPRFIRKSKTHDCVVRDAKAENIIADAAQGRITNSLSSPGLVEDQGGKRNDIDANKQAPCKQNMIDYRNFVPQMPFVPSVAKSLPRKRISLRKSKKSLKNIFNLRKNKQQDVISEDDNQPVVFTMKETKTGEKQHQISISEMASDEFLLYNGPDYDMYVDAVDSFKALCEDVASLKSFDSLTGCGEIFADESASFIDIENSRVTFISKTSPIATSFQGGVERLASPAKSESIDFSRLRGHMKSPASSLCTNLLTETKMLPVCQDVNKVEMNGSPSRDHVSNLPFNDLMSSNENIPDADSPMSTSDEGYYDSYSPGLEESKNEVGNGRPFPRDSYSGDALYELFSDSCEKKPWSSQDLPVSSHNQENHTSIYSFCVGSEENMASQPALECDGEDSHETTWKGQECLLKLCDTELSLTIGMVNWLKKTGRITENDLGDQNVTSYPKELEDMKTEKMITFEETSEMSEDSIEEICSHWESMNTEHTEHVNNIKMKENIDTVSNTSAEVPKTTINSDESKMENNSPFVTDLVLYGPSPKQNIVNNIIEFKNQLELSSVDANSLGPKVVSKKQKKPKTMNVPLLVNNLDSLQILSENNRWIMNMLERCTADMPPLQVSFGNECVLHCTGKITRPYEIAQNIKNSVDIFGSFQQTLQFTSDNTVNKKHLMRDSNEPQQANLICRKKIDHDYIGNEQYIATTSRSLPKATQVSKDVVKPGFLPLFKSTCSSVISRCSSVLYKVHNSEDAIIFFNTKKFNPLPNSNDELTKDSTSSSVDYSKYIEDGFLSITSTTFTRESGLLITKNKKWSI